MSEILITLSQIFGWTYFFSWSASFYGQIYENWKFKSVEGLKLDYVILNLIGFSCYSMYTTEGYFYPDNPYGLGKVVLQDLLFAYHALTMVIICVVQCFNYEKGTNTVSSVAQLLALGFVVEIFISYFAIQYFQWIIPTQNFNWWLLLGYFKLTLTITKYSPQVYWNWSRKCTVGWNISGILLDVVGGLFSIAQIIVDSIISGVGHFNVVKFLLGNISLLFDVIFIVQHYHTYSENNKKHEITRKLANMPKKYELLPHKKPVTGDEKET